MAHHTLFPTPDNVHWGYLSSKLDPILTLEPGDTVTIHTIAGSVEDNPPENAGYTLPPEQLATQAKRQRGPGPHPIVGPIKVAGARPGDAVKIEILDMRLRSNWGFTKIAPGRGALPDDFPIHHNVLSRLDPERNTVTLPWGLQLAAAPFFGIVSTSPSPEEGDVTSVIPGRFGGNMDIKELRPGATLRLPVFVPGALVSIGDGHAVQGDGEVCVTAVETAVTGTIRIDLEPGSAPHYPTLETADEIMALAFDEDLDQAALAALRQLIGIVCERTNLPAEDAYVLCSLAANLRISQIVNIRKGIHACIKKSTLLQSNAASLMSSGSGRNGNA